MREDKKILVTGGAGFIGTNFILRSLAIKNWRIHNLDSLTYAGNLENFKGLNDDHKIRYEFVHGDVRDEALLDRLFDEEEFDGVVHFAAESHVDRSILGPTAFLEISAFSIYPRMKYMEALEPKGTSLKERPMILRAPIQPQRRPQTILSRPIIAHMVCRQLLQTVPTTMALFNFRRN